MVSFSYKTKGVKMAQSVEKSIVKRIKGHGVGWSFSPKDFTDLGKRSAIDISLHRLHASGTIRRVMQGIYDYPKIGRLTKKQLSPDIWSVAQTIARKNGWKIVPSGETALNALGLSTQVPGKNIFLTDGNNREYKIENRTLTFKRRTPKDLQLVNGPTSIVIQALKTLGKEHVDEMVLKKIRNKLSSNEKKELLKKAQYGTDWVYEVLKRI